MTDFVDTAAITRIVISMVRSRARQAFFSDEPVPLSAMPNALRRTIVHDVACFFGLEEPETALLADGDDYSVWAERIHSAVRAKAHATVTFVTSGSTGQPCRHTFQLDDLVTEAEALQAFFADRTRVVSVMPVHHVYGFAFALMLPRLLRIPVLETPPLPSADFFQGLQDGDMVLAFPFFWKSFMDTRSGQSAYPAVNIHGVTSGAPCPPEIIEGLLAASGPFEGAALSGMTEIYGATEFGAVGMRRQCRGQYTLLPHWRRTALPPEEDGGGAAWGIKRKTGQAMSLPDVIEWRDERSFVPLRRKDRAVQVGGINVFPSLVADILRRHPKVRDCAVRMMRPEEGSRLKAFIVPSGEVLPAHDLARELRQWLATRLDTASMPRSFSFGPNVPLTSSGKFADWNIGGNVT